MNVRSMANAATSTVTRNTMATLVKNQGYTTDAAGHRTPLQQFLPVRAQVQGVSANDLQHLDGMNVQGVMRSVHLHGDIGGVVRIDQKGGDTLLFAEVPTAAPQTWLVVKVMETWQHWCRVIVVMQ